ncbi:MAG: hypothetical protein AB7T10_04765 [bacterium]
MEYKVKVGFVSTFPPVVSGLSRYAEELCDFINASGREIEAEKLSIDRFSPYRKADSASIAECDVAIYNLGNHPMNLPSYKAALKNPSICILHEYTLDSFRGKVMKSLPALSPLKMLIRSGNIFVVHTAENVRRLVSLGADAVQIRHMQYRLFPKVPDATFGADAFHIRKFAFSSLKSFQDADNGYIGAFGYVSYSKGAREILDGYEEYLRRGGRLNFLFAGNEADFPLRKEISRRKLASRVEFVENPDDLTFDSLIASCSAGVNLRLTDSGETSGNMLKLFSLCKPVAMNKTFSSEEDFAKCYFEVRRNSCSNDLAEFFASVERKDKNLYEKAITAKRVSSERNSIELVTVEWIKLLTNPSLKARIRRAKAEGKRKFFMQEGR